MQRVSFLTLIIITLALISATVVEKVGGSEAAALYCYHSPWMIALRTICAATALISVMTMRRAMTAGVLSLHLSLLLILAGAAVTHFTGEHGHITLHPHTPVSSFSLSDGSHRSLPFSLTLTDCGIEYYPGTRSPRDYYSVVATTDAGATATTSHRISMNRTLDLHGYRFCQSGLGGDSSTLSVNHDPWGIGITFAGYGLLFLSMTVALFERNGRFRRNLRRLATGPLMLLCLVALPANATETTPTTLQRPLAKTFGTLYISDNGRIEPLQTFARDFCMTVCGKDSYKGLTPEQVLAGWIFYYDKWKHEPMIRLKSRRAREAMDGHTHVSLAQLYSGGQYRLQHIIDSTPDDRDLTADDNRVALITTVCTGSALTTLPVRETDGTVTWYSWADRLPPHLDTDTALVVGSTISDIYNDINHGRFRKADSELRGLRAMQRAMAAGSLPSDTAIAAERLYNITFYPLLSAILTLISGIIALVMYLYDSRRLRRLITLAAWTAFAYTTYIIILRWIAGGHIPLATGYETMLALAWIALVLSLWCGRRIPVMWPLGIIVAGAALLVAMMGSKNPAMGTLMPVLVSRLLSLHVMLVMTSYALFGIIALAAAIGLASVPRRQRMSVVCVTLLIPALFLLGAGIFTGAIWANQSWGRYWGWDPKETWALITFFIYALPLHSMSLRWFRSPRTILLYLLLAFLSVLMTYLGVNYLMTGLHSYGVS